MERKFAIARLSNWDLERLCVEDRAEQLDIMMLCEGWDEDSRWPSLSSELRTEFDNGELQSPSSDAKYDAVLLLWLTDRYRAATNGYLLGQLQRIGVNNVDAVTGKPAQLEACPCCGYRTLGSRGDYEICRVCWWEDDGQDNDDADKVLGGPNYHLSLTQGRRNYLNEGISDPTREDLREKQEPADKYVQGRKFNSTGDDVFELIGGPT